MTTPMPSGAISNSGKPGPHMQDWYEEKEKAFQKQKAIDEANGIVYSACYLFDHTKFDQKLTVHQRKERSSDSTIH